MKLAITESIESRWARLGVSFGVAPSKTEPDLEQLVTESCVAIPANPRLHDLIVSWLVAQGDCVARLRLRRFLTTHCDAEAQAIAGLLIDEAIQNGASPALSDARESAQPISPQRPLFDVDRQNAAFVELARLSASDVSLRWGLWKEAAIVKQNAIRPPTWIALHNPSLRDRAIRKGDLRVSILETLRLDCGGTVASEQELARLTCASRAGVRKAIAALEREGAIRVDRSGVSRQGHPIHLILPAA